MVEITKVEAPELIYVDDEEFVIDLAQKLKAGEISLSQLTQERAREVMNYIIEEENGQKRE